MHSQLTKWINPFFLLLLSFVHKQKLKHLHSTTIYWQCYIVMHSHFKCINSTKSGWKFIFQKMRKRLRTIKLLCWYFRDRKNISIQKWYRFMLNFFFFFFLSFQVIFHRKRNTENLRNKVFICSFLIWKYFNHLWLNAFISTFSFSPVPVCLKMHAHTHIHTSRTRGKCNWSSVASNSCMALKDFQCRLHFQ